MTSKKKQLPTNVVDLAERRRQAQVRAGLADYAPRSAWTLAYLAYQSRKAGKVAAHVAEDREHANWGITRHLKVT